MRLARLPLLMLLAAASAAACVDSSQPTEPDGLVHIEDGRVSGTATVRRSTSLGNFYYLELRGGGVYLPEALPETVRRNGVPVVFEGVLRPDIPTTVMIGTVIEITRIERRR